MIPVWIILLVSGFLAILLVIFGIFIAWVVDNRKELFCKHDFHIHYIYSLSDKQCWNTTRYKCSKCSKIKIITE